MSTARRPRRRHDWALRGAILVGIALYAIPPQLGLSMGWALLLMAAMIAVGLTLQSASARRSVASAARRLRPW